MRETLPSDLDTASVLSEVNALAGKDNERKIRPGRLFAYPVGQSGESSPEGLFRDDGSAGAFLQGLH